jgi:hypothetical protein
MILLWQRLVGNALRKPFPAPVFEGNTRINDWAKRERQASLGLPLDLFPK